MNSLYRTKKQHFIFDPWLVGASLSLLCLGLLMVASSSMVISDHQFGTPFHFVWRELLFLCAGLGIMIIVISVPTDIWSRYSVPLFFIGCLGLVMVLVPGIGHQVNGSRRWIPLLFFNVQPSELMKFCFIIYLSGYIVRHQQTLQTCVMGFVRPLVLLGFVALLLLMEPDFGATTVITVVAMSLLFLAGVPFWRFVPLVMVAVCMLGLLAVFEPYRLERLTAFLNPWANQFDSGYQLTQSLIAFGRGGIFGVGLGNSVQKLFYLPEAHTDFLFAVLGEELGLIGQLFVCALFIVVVSRGLYMGYQAIQSGHLFKGYVAYGLSLWTGFQVMINLGVNLGVLPTKGLTLPLMSYGGSSLLVSCLVVALLLRIYHELAVEGCV